MDFITGFFCVATVYIILMSVFRLVIGLPVPLSMALSLLGAIVVVATNWKRLDRMSRPSQNPKKPRGSGLPGGNRQARRSKR